MPDCGTAIHPKVVTIMLKRFEIKDGGIHPSLNENGQILVFVCPDKDEISYLTNTFQLDEHTVQSALDPDELSRLEIESNHYALIFKRPRNYSSEEQFLFKVSSIGIFMFKDCMIILISEDVPLFEGKQSFRAQSLQDVLLKIIYSSIAHFIHHLRVINMISDEIEQKVNTSMENKYLIQMFTLEKSLVYYLNAENSNAMVIDKLRIGAQRLGFTPENIELLEDIYIENNQCLKQTEIYSNIISSLTNARASIVSNNLNVSMKNLNALVISIAVPSFFAGVGGMSEFSMMTSAKNWMLSYPLFVVGMVVIGVGTFYIIKKAEKYWR
jgi:magnesium transporter